MSENKGNMYRDTSTWNPYVGCLHDCVYCGPSFKKTLKRVSGNPYVREGSLSPTGTSGDKGGCRHCYTHTIHYHSERLHVGGIPNSPVVFVFGQSDIKYCSPGYVRRTIDVIKRKQSTNHKWAGQLIYWQSKDPICLEQYLSELPDNSIVLTTLETNYDNFYKRISKAPIPSVRFEDFLALDFPRKVVTIEPCMDFILDGFIEMILQLKEQGSLLYVWFGFDTKNCDLPEPRGVKAQAFVNILIKSGVKVIGKNLTNKYGETITLPKAEQHWEEIMEDMFYRHQRNMYEEEESL